MRKSMVKIFLAPMTGRTAVAPVIGLCECRRRETTTSRNSIAAKSAKAKDMQ